MGVSTSKLAGMPIAANRKGLIEDPVSRPLLRPLGRSICDTSPVTMQREDAPRRVKNIFICSGVVFWASSKMIKASPRVRPRMKARGATSSVPRSVRRW